MPPPRCVVLVPVAAHVEPECERALRELERRGLTVREVRGFTAPDAARSRMATDALADGFHELVWVDPAAAFRPDDVALLRAHGRPFVCGLYPRAGGPGLACVFPPDVAAVTLGRGGGLAPLAYTALGLAYTRREVYAAVRQRFQLPTLNARAGKALVPYFAPVWVGDGAAAQYLADEYAFCERARQAGFPPVADTRVRLGRVGRKEFGWADAGAEPAGEDTFRLAVRPPAYPPPPAPPPVELPPAAAEPDADAGPGPLREPAAPLSSGFPRLGLYVVTYPANADSLAPTLAGIRASDWGTDPVVLTQPADWAPGREAGARTYRRALERAAADGVDFAVVLEDDVRVNRHLRHNLVANPLVRRDAADYLGLFMPDLVAAPWERAEPPLGYRLARPRYGGPDEGWAKHRVWGAQGYCLSGRLVRALLARWDRLAEGQDTRVLTVCHDYQLPLWYTLPCLVEHAPVRSAFGTPAARAVDFDPDFRLTVGPGFQPPDGVPGRLTIEEGRALFTAAAGRSVLELGTGSGRATVCLAQAAARVVSVGPRAPAVAAEWANRFGVADRVEFRREDPAAFRAAGGEQFGLVCVAAGSPGFHPRGLIEAAIRVLAPDGLLAVRDYPDPDRPSVRVVVDEAADRLGWVRTAQADYLAVFRTGRRPGGRD